MTAGRPLRFLIIGHGIAGLAAAKAIRRRSPTASLAILTDENHRFYSRPGLAYYLSGDIPERQLFTQPDSLYRELRCSLIFGRAIRIDANQRRVRLADGSVLAYDALLLATGAHAARPSIPGIDLEGVVTLDTLDDTRHLLKLARRARRAVVVGGGITALEIAEGLAARGVETHYLLRKDRYWNSVLDPAESEIVEAGLAHEGVILHKQTEVESLEDRRGRVRAVVTSSGQRIACNMLGVAIGIRPRIGLADASGVETDRGILVDETMQTNLPGIYAAGDVAQVYDPEQDAYRLDSLWWTAEQQGSTAGANMAGDRMPYIRKTPFNVTRIGGLVTTIIGDVGSRERDADVKGIMRGDSENWRHSVDCITVQERNGSNRIRLMVGQDRLVGALVMGDQTLSRPIQHYVQDAIPLGELGDMLRTQPETALDMMRQHQSRSPVPTGGGSGW
ncbi:MAG: FAD/NAD(P)-binding oxidoreductase [Anaerolineales bacterium]